MSLCLDMSEILYVQRKEKVRKHNPSEITHNVVPNFMFIKKCSIEAQRRRRVAKLILSWVSSPLDLFTDLLLLLRQKILPSFMAFILPSCFLCLLFLFVPVHPPLSSVRHTSGWPKMQQVQAKNQFTDI